MIRILTSNYITPVITPAWTRLCSNPTIRSRQRCLIRPLENWSMGYCVYCFQLFNKNGWNPVSGFAKICKNH